MADIELELAGGPPLRFCLGDSPTLRLGGGTSWRPDDIRSLELQTPPEAIACTFARGTTVTWMVAERARGSIHGFYDMVTSAFALQTAPAPAPPAEPASSVANAVSQFLFGQSAGAAAASLQQGFGTAAVAATPLAPILTEASIWQPAAADLAALPYSGNLREVTEWPPPPPSAQRDGHAITPIAPLPYPPHCRRIAGHPAG